eukprot:g18273.t2
MNNYHLYEEIGRGKYSQVYKGRQKFTIQFVAVKSVEKCRREKVMTEKRPPRRWMSVQDLVTEVEQALVEGERLDEDSQAYANLRREAQSLRLENDALGEKVAELEERCSDDVTLGTRVANVLLVPIQANWDPCLNHCPAQMGQTSVSWEEARKKYIAQEEELTAKLKEDGGFFAFEKDIVEMTGKIQEVDYKIAGLRHKHHHNIKDVGSLKRTMSLIEKRGKVTTLIDKTEEALDRGQVSQAAQLEADLSEVVERLRQESAKIWPKISSYEANIAELSTNMSETQEKLQVVLHTPTREADNLRTHLKGQINQVKRMLRKAIKELESGLSPLTEEAGAITDKLRSMPFAFTTETGKLREQLIANIHQESQWKERLAVLRGEKLQNIRFIAMLMKALRDT